MSPSSPSSSPAAKRPHVFHVQWTPQPWLLELESGQHGLIAELIDAFRTTGETSLRQMRTALATGDLSKLRRGAHRTGGSARQLGADALAEVCQALELAPSLTSVWNLAELVDFFQQLFDETGSAMASYSKGNEAMDHSAAQPSSPTVALARAFR
jgi:HPt (histidine-containing phosphotransfer) domain-containing protein